MAHRRTIFSILGGAACAALIATAATAQKAPTPADPLVGLYGVTGQNVHECRVSIPSGTLEVRAPERPGGDYPVRVRQSWRTQPLPGCPEPESPSESWDYEGALRRQGNLVALVLRGPDGRVLGPWGYQIEGNALRFICESCVKTNFRWVRQGR